MAVNPEREARREDGICPAEAERPFPEQRRGSALITVLWIVGLLSLVVVSFAFDALIEGKVISYYRKRMKADALARSGLEIAEMLMSKSIALKGKPEPDDKDADVWYGEAKRLSEGQAIRGLSRAVGDGTVRVDIVPEPARRNVNLLKEEDWERILEVGEVPQEQWPDLIDSVMDWIDPDDKARMRGAETDDTYARLEPSYRAKNGPLDTVGELLLVKGVNRAILYGGVLETNNPAEASGVISGIDDLLTTYSDGKVNINAASQRVLMTLPGVDEIVSGAIIEEREGIPDDKGVRESKPFKGPEDLYGRIPNLSTSLRNYITTDSGIFRLTLQGTVHGVTRQIWCIVRYSNKQLTILQWREDD